MSRILAFAICFSVSFSFGLLAHGQNTGTEPKREAAVIEPYKGPPIYFPEESQVEAQWVAKSVDVQKYASGQPKTEREISRFSDNRLVNDGYYREFYENGQLFLEGGYERGTPVGEWKYFHDNGKPSKVVKYEDGKPTGEIEVRRADGSLQAKRLFKDAKREGLWITYDTTGEKPLKEENYVEGKPDGVWKLWHDNGQPAQESTFKVGKREGVHTEWDKEGVKRAEVTFADGQRDGKMSIWALDGKVTEQTFKAGKLVTELGK